MREYGGVEPGCMRVESVELWVGFAKDCATCDVQQQLSDSISELACLVVETVSTAMEEDQPPSVASQLYRSIRSTAELGWAVKQSVPCSY